MPFRRLQKRNRWVFEALGDELKEEELLQIGGNAVAGGNAQKQVLKADIHAA